MTTPTREQVVQWADDAGFDSIDDPYHNRIEIADSGNSWITKRLESFATLARADLEATIAEQAAEIEQIKAVSELGHSLFAKQLIVNDQLRQQLTEQQAHIETLLGLIKAISGQTPEKPDYWASCGQCERNISEAEELLAIQSSTDALKEHDAQLVARIAASISADVELSRNSLFRSALKIASGKIRKGEFLNANKDHHSVAFPMLVWRPYRIQVSSNICGNMVRCSAYRNSCNKGALAMTDKIREVFNKYRDENSITTNFGLLQESFEAGYQAAIDSFEQVGFTFDVELDYMRTADPRRGPTAALWPDSGGEQDAIPLYRIDPPKENIL